MAPRRWLLAVGAGVLQFALGGLLLPHVPGFPNIAGLPIFNRTSGTDATASLNFGQSCAGNNDFQSQFVLPPPAQWPEPELWASGTSHAIQNTSKLVADHLGPAKLKEAEELCSRCLYHTLLEGRTIVFGADELVWVSTGDITDEWLRDGAVQVGVFLPRLDDVPGLRGLVDGAIRTMAFYTVQDPWANSFSLHYKAEMPPHDFELGRQGFTATRNFEVDSGAYFFNLLYNYYATEPSIWGREQLLNESVIRDAVMVTLKLYRLEQEHENSPYRYIELPEGGKGKPVGYTGMVWGGFRPSDEMQQYGYNIPVNMYLVGALEKIILLNSGIWRDSEIENLAGELAEQVRTGIERFGRVPAKDSGEMIYAYEVDGLGNHLADHDDPNVPSLMSVPILGYRHYDREIYKRTRDRLNSPINPYYYETDYEAAKGSYSGEKVPFFGGQGSTHTPKGNVWPLGIMIEAMLDPDPIAKADAIRLLLEMQCGNGLLHESNNVNNIRSCSRVTFEWANTLFVVLYEHTLGKTCQQAFEKRRVKELGDKMKSKGLSDQGLFYGTMMSWVEHWTGAMNGKNKERIRQEVINVVKEQVNVKFNNWTMTEGRKLNNLTLAVEEAGNIRKLLEDQLAVEKRKNEDLQKEIQDWKLKTEEAEQKLSKLARDQQQ